MLACFGRKISAEQSNSKLPRSHGKTTRRAEVCLCVCAASARRWSTQIIVVTGGDIGVFACRVSVNIINMQTTRALAFYLRAAVGIFMRLPAKSDGRSAECGLVAGV